MEKKILLILSFILLIILSSGCGGDSTSTVPAVNTPTPAAATPTAPVSQVISSLTEIEAKRVTISAKDGGTVTEGNMTVEIPGNSIEADTSVEIAKVNINGVTASNRNNVTEQYKISTGKEDISYELQEPSTVRIKADNNKIPLIWNGGEWLPVDYTYDGNTNEIVMELNCLDEDINEWTDEGGEMGTVEQPLVVGVGSGTDYKDFVQKGHFKVYYSNPGDKSYGEAVARSLESAYGYYIDVLNYNKPVKTILSSYSESDYIYAYIYYPSPSNSNFQKDADGVANMTGYMGFNKAKLDPNTLLGQSVCYHELFHLIQFSYTNREGYPNWFDESMAVSMQYYAINNPKEIYDLDTDPFWTPPVFLVENFDNPNGYYYSKYPVWSYIIQKENPKILHTIMKEFHSAPFSIEALNKVFESKCKKDFVTYFNDFSEDYYMGGTFFNKTYFNKLKERPEGMPYVFNPMPFGDLSYNYSITIFNNPLTVKYIYYDFSNNNETYKFEFSEKSNCKVKFFYLKLNNGTYTVTSEEISDVKSIDNSVEKIKGLFILFENTTVNAKAIVTLNITKEK